MYEISYLIAVIQLCSIKINHDVEKHTNMTLYTHICIVVDDT